MEIPNNYLLRFKISNRPEWQVLGKELEPIYGKGIYVIFHKVGFTESKIRDAHKICQQKGITKIGYLIGVIKRLK